MLFSLPHSNLLFLSPVSTDTEPLFVLEFLHRIIDVLEEFIGAPLLASKIEGSYDVVAQLLGEMCDAGSVCNTEPNALRDDVEIPGWMGKLLGGVGLPGYDRSLIDEFSMMKLSGPTPKIITGPFTIRWPETTAKSQSHQQWSCYTLAPRQCSPYE